MKEVIIKNKNKDTDFYLLDSKDLLILLHRAAEWEVYKEFNNNLTPRAREDEINKKMNKFLNDYEIVSVNLPMKEGEQ